MLLELFFQWFKYQDRRNCINSELLLATRLPGAKVNNDVKRLHPSTDVKRLLNHDICLSHHISQRS
jgi:hypothetical protein